MMFFNLNQGWYILRMIIAGLCGFVIGVERKNRAKEAGVRTHCVVACASALMMIISKYCFADMPIGADGFRGADGARIAAQVVSGIGFLGAGMIFVHKNTVTGLTTAAGIWATSGIGLAIGGGMYIVGIASTIIIVFIQIVLHKDLTFLKTTKSRKLVVKGVDSKGYQRCIVQMLEKKGVVVHEVYIEKNQIDRNYTFIIEIPQNVAEEEVIEVIEYNCRLIANA